MPQPAVLPVEPPVASARRRAAIDAIFSPRAELTAAISAGVLLLLGVLFLPALIWVSLGLGLVYAVRASAGALRGGSINIDVLMVVAAALAAWIGHPEDGALLLVLFVLSGALEALAMERTQREVRALHALIPRDAEAWIDGGWRQVDPGRLLVGQRIRIGSGEMAPVDAVIVSGSTSFDQSAMTGESAPRSVGPGDELFAGTVNAEHPVECEVLRIADDSSVRRMLRLVTEAQEQREPIQRTIDRLGQPYALSIFGLSLGVLLVWALVLGRTWADSSMTAVTFLIVASPCALVIATPTATLAAISRAARAGVLFKGGQAAERLARVSAMCLDKTGTLTRGRPRLERLVAFPSDAADELLALAVALEQGSTHPIASAIREAGQGARTVEVVDLRASPGKGVQAMFEGHEARLGGLTHVGPVLTESSRAFVSRELAAAREQGGLTTVVACNGRAGVLVLTDEIRPSAGEFIRQLHALGVSPVRMLTGDHHLPARAVASQVGIDAVDAELLPEDKVRMVAETRAGGARVVGVVGDGINDAPALAAADVSIALGGIGSDAAVDSADIVLINTDLTRVPWAIRLARRTRATVVLNLSMAMGVIAVMGFATLFGSVVDRPVALSVGVLAHEGGTVVVVLNSLRLLWYR